MIAPTSDAVLLARLHAQCFSEPWSADSFAALLANPGCFALAAEDGFIVVQVVLDQSEVLSLGVTPAARRRGIASELLSAAIKQAAECGVITMFLEVDCSNFPAIALYKRLGFAEMGRRKAYYTTPDGQRSDALTLCTEIPARLVGNCVQLG
ncbi:MAG: ribosomal protein S18-alanine N-acetyltransferase [Rhizomicrobium sp.]|nr:ribosomal protein S18-alanine N-acetyltransferase [Rhizomicrobium sp.]